MSDWSFARRGFSLFPVHRNGKTPAISAWEPYQFAPAPPDQIAAWSKRQTNTGVALGAVSGAFVFDVDSLLARVLAEERGIPETLTIATPRGTHWYFRHPGWPVTNHAGRTWTKPLDGVGVDGWDIRGDGGYVVGPGSWYEPTPAELAAGKVAGGYTIELDVPLAPAPQWLLGLLVPAERAPRAPVRFTDVTSAWGRTALNGEIAKIMETRPNDGACNNVINTAAFKIAQRIAGGEINEEEARGAIEEALATIGAADDGKSDGTVDRAFAAGFLEPVCAADEGRQPVTPEQALGVRGPVPAAAAPQVDLSLPFVPPDKPTHVIATNMHEYFRGCVYVARRDEMFHPVGVLIGKSAFDGLYNGPNFTLEKAGEKIEKSAWVTFRQNAHTEMPKAWDICFRPELAPGTIVDIAGLPFLNTYVPVAVPRRAGDASRFVEHVRKMLPNGQDADYLLHWMASCVQNPGVKFQWWPVIQGVKGNGKSFLLDCMLAAIPERYTHKVSADSVMKTGNQFNGWIEQRLFLGFEEIRTSEGKRDFVELMKETVTASRISTESKGKGQATSDNRANGMMLTNHDDAAPIDNDERRWGIFYCAQQKFEDLERDGMDKPYFAQLYDWARKEGGHAVITDYLLTMPLEYEMDPARGLQRAPETSSTRDAVVRSFGLIEQEIQEAIESEQVGFRGGVVVSFALKALVERMRKNLAPRRYRAVMSSLGYETHPALAGNRGRPNNPLYDGSLPTLYFKRGCEILASDNYAEIINLTERIMRGDISDDGKVVPFRRP